MVLPHGSESWRKLSRFRRQTQVKPLAAEVLEPRCLMTEAVGLASENAGGDIVVDASLWDDAGLTLLRAGDLVHLVRTGTMQDVVAPFVVDAPGSLVIQGRNDASDVLTIDLSGVTAGRVTDHQDPALLAKKVIFSGGSGLSKDELQFVGQIRGGLSTQFDVRERDDWSLGRSTYQTGLVDPIKSGWFNFEFQQVEMVVDRSNTTIYRSDFLNFSDDDNVIGIEHVTLDGRYSNYARISEYNLGITIEVPADNCDINSGAGNDVVTIQSARSGKNDNAGVFGGDGDDTLIGGDGNEVLYGGPGDDQIEGRGAGDVLCGGEGNDRIDGGDGFDLLRDYASPNSVIDIGDGEMRGMGDDQFTNIEHVSIEGYDHVRIDATEFPGRVFLAVSGGSNTLIGGARDDALWAGGGNNLVLGGDGVDYLDGDDSETDTLIGESGNDRINGNWDGSPIYFPFGAANYHPDVRRIDPVIDTLYNHFGSVTSRVEPTTVDQDDTEPSPSTDESSELTFEEPSGGIVTVGEELIFGDSTDRDLADDIRDDMLIGQGIAADGIEDLDLAEFDTASSDSAFGELADSEPEDGERPTEETLANGGDLAADDDFNFTDVGEGLELDAALSDDFLKAIGETPLES